MLRLALGVLLTFSASTLLLNPTTATAADSQYQKVVNHSQRPQSDLPRDKSRLPVKLLEFMQLKPGMVVFEQGAGGGYTTELLARAVGKTGKVFAEGLDPGRLSDNRLPQVKALERGLVYQIPDRANKAGLKNGEADAVIMMFTYHDLTLNDRIDRQDLLQNMKTLMKKGGSIFIADNAAVEGSGLRYTPQLHRIDKAFVIKEFKQAGFELASESDIYSNPQDNLKAHWRFLAKPRHHDRMLIRFTKP
jgi:predicted methyltransferase